MRVKICGITQVEDALVAEAAGADAIGLIFAPASKRYVSLDQALEISQALGVFTSCIGVFVNAPIEQVVSYSRQLRLDAVQLHGQEDEAYARALRQRIDVIRVKAFEPSLEWAQLQGLEADAIMLDSPKGGSGETFDWQQAQHVKGFPHLIVAGGLNPDNVTKAIESLAPYAVDVASGVERAPGIKDAAKVQDFVSRAKQAGLSTVIHKE